MHTVELLLDEHLDADVRALWHRLHDAGLPSLATHRHPTNRPHLTVITAASLPTPLKAELPAELPAGLPLEAELGEVRMLGRALVRAVTPTAALTSLHARLAGELPDAWPPPADFVPHVSLALRVPPDRHAAALRLLAGVPPARGSFVAFRSYDTVTREVSP